MDAACVQQAAQQNIHIEALPFIQVMHRQDKTTQTAIENMLPQKYLAIFTSKNALEAIRPFLKTIPQWQIACISGTTSEKAADIFGEEKIIYTAATGQALAAALIKKIPALPIAFFAGNQRLNAIPTALNEAKLQWEEIIVYDTIETAQVVSKKYDGIIFLSPSAVRSFFSANSVEKKTLLFALGPTTANAIKEIGENEIVVSGVYTQQSLTRELIHYYHDKK